MDTIQKNKPAFRILGWFTGVVGIFVVLNLLFPQAMSIVLNTVWFIFIAITIIFFTLGVLVIIGLRQEVNKILDILMEGSLSVVDFIRFLKLVWLKFLELLKEFILYITPLLAYVLALVLYTLLMTVYKKYGITHDVTVFTLVLTITMVFIIGFLNRRSKKPLDLNVWANKVKNVFKSSFIDAFEVVLFIFFLTMDSTKLFFLPQELNVLLKAEYKNYDLMVRAFVNDGSMRITVNIIVTAIIIELVRNVLKIAASARKYYVNDILLFSDGIIASRSTRIKTAIRKAFKDAKDELIRFITFTTVLFAVFLFFPRLKLLTLSVASAASLILDIIIVDRMFFAKSNDLVSRILGKIFKL